MKNRVIKIGTRGSQLALYQANLVKYELEKKLPDQTFEVVIIKTKGDKILDVPLAKIGDKGLFTKEIEEKLLDGGIDMAVHSMKDLPTTLPEGLLAGAVLKRGEFRDALITLDGRKLNELHERDVIATSSLRRRAGLLHINPDFQLTDIRGNVQTRLQKLENGHCTALIMAAAGLQRLNLDKYISEIIDSDRIIPAVSQGTIAVEIRERDEYIGSLCDTINDTLTQTSILAERAFMQNLQGGCQVPIGCYTSVSEEKLSITGFVASIDGAEYLKDQAEGNLTDPESIGLQLANKLLKAGAKRILDSIRLKGI